MADNVKPTYAKSDIKSGAIGMAFIKILGGLPDKKDVDQIEKESEVKKAPDAAGV